MAEKHPGKRHDPPTSGKGRVARSAPGGNRASGRRRVQWIFLLGALVVVILLSYRSPLGREFGVRCLGKIGPRSVPVLRRALWDESFDVQAAAKEELIRLAGRAVPPLVRSLRDHEIRTRIQSLHALTALGSLGREAAPAVVPLLDDPDAEVRIQTLNTLGALGEPGPAVTTALVRAMSDPKPEVRLLAAKTLGDIRASSDIVLPALFKALNDPDDNVRFGAIVVFGKLKLRSAPALAALRGVAANDVSSKVREEASEVLALLDPQGRPTTANLDVSPAGFDSASQTAGTEVAVHVGRISVATLRQYVTAFGTVEPEPGTPGEAAASAKITSPLAGLVAEVKCAEGQQVEQGQVLFTLDRRKLDAGIAQARAMLAAAEKNFGEQEKISKTDSATQLLFAKARQERELARSELDFALAQQALLNVTAPLAGTAVLVNVRPGEMLDPESPIALVEIVDLSRLMVVASVPAADLPAVKAGQAVEISPPPNGAGVQTVLTGQVAFVEDRVNPGTDLGAVDISLPAPAQLRCGQFVRLKIVTEERRDCLAVTSPSLVQNEDGEWVIFLARGNLAVAQPVKPGLRDGGLIEVQSPAIKAGDRVVTTGAAALPAKTVIRILKD